MLSASPIVDEQIAVLVIGVILVGALATCCSPGGRRSTIIVIVRAIGRVWRIQGAYVVSLSAAGGTSTPTSEEVARRRGGSGSAKWRLYPTLTTILAVLTILMHEISPMLCFARHIESHIAICMKLVVGKLAISCLRRLLRHVDTLLVIGHEGVRALVARLERSLTTRVPTCTNALLMVG